MPTLGLLGLSLLLCAGQANSFNFQNMKETLSTDISNFMKLNDMTIYGHAVVVGPILATPESTTGGRLGTLRNIEEILSCDISDFMKLKDMVIYGHAVVFGIIWATPELVTGGHLGTLPK